MQKQKYGVSNDKKVFRDHSTKCTLHITVITKTGLDPCSILTNTIHFSKSYLNPPSCTVLPNSIFPRDFATKIFVTDVNME